MFRDFSRLGEYPLKFLRVLTLIQRGALTLLALFTVYWGATLFVSAFSKSLSLHPTLSQSKRPGILFSRNAIGKNALSLKGDVGSFAIPNLEEDLLLLKIGGVHSVDKSPILGLSGSGQYQLIESGDRLYLNTVQGSWVFSEEKTPLLLEIQQVGDQRVTLSLHLELDDGKGNSVIHEDAALTLSLASSEKYDKFLRGVSWGKGLKKLENAQLLLPDKLFEIYGGQEFKDKQGKQRLFLDDPSRVDILVVSPGDLLVYDQEKWRLMQRDEETEKRNIAKILGASSQRIEIEVWEPRGLLSKKITLNPPRTPPTKWRLEEIFSKARARTSTTLSIKLDQKSFMLKAGDWLFCQNGKWKLLGTWDEIEEVMDYQKTGELFIFDSLERAQGKMWLCGHAFDSMRTQVQAVKLPLAQKKESRPMPAPMRPPEQDNLPAAQAGALNGEEGDEEAAPPPMPQPGMREPYYRR